MGFILVAWLAGQLAQGSSGGAVENGVPAEAGSKCVITMASCPAHPRMYALPAFVDEDYRDDNLSSRSMARCMERAGEYHAWCGALVPTKAAFHEAGRLVQANSVGERRVRLDVEFAQLPLPSGYDTDADRLGTQNGWAPGAPRMVRNALGTFAVLLRNDSPARNLLRFDLAWKPSGGSEWQPIAPNLGPALSDPILLTDGSDRLHVLYPSSESLCEAGVDKGNVAHRVFRREEDGWSSSRVRTEGIWAGSRSACGGYPRAQRFGAAIDEPGGKLQLVFYDLAGKSHRVGFAAFDLSSSSWGPMAPVGGTGAPSDGAGYSYVAPGGDPGMVSFITTNFKGGDYFRVSWLRSADGGEGWDATVLCQGTKNCLTGDILQDSRGRVHLMFQLDAANGGATPLADTGVLRGRRANYLLSSDRGSAAYPIVDSSDPEGPSPDWRAALGQVGELLVVLGPTDQAGIGLWVSKDFGLSWHFKDLSSKLDPGAKVHQFRLNKRQYGSSWAPLQPLAGMYTELSNRSRVRTYEFELGPVALEESGQPIGGLTCAQHSANVGWQPVCDNGEGFCLKFSGGAVGTQDCKQCCDAKGSCGDHALRKGWKQPVCDVEGTAHCGSRGVATWDCNRCCNTVTTQSCEQIAQEEGWPSWKCGCNGQGVGAAGCGDCCPGD